MLRFCAFLLVLTASATAPFVASADCMGPYPPSMVKAFSQSCATDATMTSYCTCLMDGVQKNIPLSDFIEISNTAGINNDPRFTRVSKTCAALLPNAPSSNANTNTMKPPTVIHR